MTNSQIPLSLLVLHYFFIITITTTTQTAAAITPSYTPTEHILLDCGSASNSSSANSRQWQADNLSNFLQKSQTAKASEQSSSVPQTPYMTARIFFNESTYSFPSLSPGPKFLRLYFYPATYNQNLNKTTSFFSVMANQNTLLSNFSAFLTVSSIKPPSATLIKEYIIHINDTHQQLNLTFLPNSGSYAFVNGIELVSIPNDLYFKGDNVPIKTSSTTSYYLKNDQALETLYRLNIGGVFVPETGDTGMFRQWIPDEDFVFATSLSASRNVEVNYTSSTPAYSAPEIVYTSARFLNDDYSSLFNMTWVFPVDSGYYYLLRLHFCEFFLEIRKPGDRIFAIFINNINVEEKADVISWANGPDIAVFRDYMTYVGDPNGQKGKQDLILTMKPASPETLSFYANALLNGLEIFKISLSNGSLSSPNPDLPPVSTTPFKQPTQPFPPKNKKGKIWPMDLEIAGGTAAVLMVAFLSFLVFRKRKKVEDCSANEIDTRKSPLQALCRRFSLDEIKCASHNFDDNFVIGVGGFGNVYKGYIDNDLKPVAIKRLNPSSNQGITEFRAEIEMLSKLRHLHLVSLIGYCDEGNEKILVYDYMSRGTLRDHLYNNVEKLHLPWKQRLQICVGVAKGLFYLHTGINQTIIHRDIKSTNILLDERWVAKVSDFGLSKMFPSGSSKPHISTVVKGSFGYLDPDYFKRRQLTEKSDVYSFGVVLLEVLLAKPAITQRLPGKHVVSLAHLAQEHIVDGTLEKIIDPRVKGEIVRECFNKYVEIAFWCINPKGSERPSMSDVVWCLEFALRLQEDAEKRMNCMMDKDGYEGSSHVPSPFYAVVQQESASCGFSMSSSFVFGR